MGFLYKVLKKFELSIEMLEKAILINPFNIFALNYKASVLSEIHKFKEAKALINTIIKMDPYFISPYMTLGNIYKLQGS